MSGEYAKEAWQAAKLSDAEEINFLKATNAKLEEARVSHLEGNERLQKENEELKKTASAWEQMYKDLNSRIIR